MAGDWEVQDTVPMDQFAAPPVASIDVSGAKPEQWTPISSHPTAGPSGNLWTDVKRRAGTMGTEALGTYLGLPHGAAQGVDWLRSLLPGTKPDSKVADFVGSLKQPATGGTADPLFPEPATAREMAYKTTGATEYVPETYWGRIGQAALNAAAAGGPGGLRTLPGAAGGGATSEMAGEWAADRGWSPAAQFFARLAGGVPGQAVATKASNLALPPAGGKMDPGTARLAQMATDTYGVPIAIGDATPNRLARAVYSETGKMPFSGAHDFNVKQLEAWTRAVTRQFGEDADRVTPELLKAARDRLGQQFEGFANRSGIQLDPQVGTDLQRVIQRMRFAGMEPAERDAIRELSRTMVNEFDPATGRLSGDAYLRLTRTDSPFDIASNSGSANVREFADRVRTVLDDALQRTAKPEDVAALKQARTQWKAMKTVEPLTVRSDAPGVVTPSTGEISPAALLSAVTKSYDGATRALPGQLPLMDLARIGQRFLKEGIADSQTATRSQAHHVIGAPAAAVGALMAGEHFGLPFLASAATGAAALGSGKAINTAMRNEAFLRRAVAAALNPDGFQFRRPNPAVSALTAAQPNQSAPFSFAPQEPSQ